MNEDQIIEYFRQIAIKMKYLQHSDSSRHFTEMDVVEIDSTLRVMPSWPCLILITPEIKLNDASEKVTIQFMMMDKLKEGDNHTKRKEILSKTLQKGKQVLAKIQDDAENKIIKGMPMVRQAGIYKVGPRWDNAYGRLFEFEWTISNNMCISAEEWL